MKTSDRELRKRFVLAIDEVLPSAPWLESHVVDTVTRRARRRTFDMGGVVDFGPGLRLAAGVVAILIALATVAALLAIAHLHATSVPAGPRTHVQIQSPAPPPAFTPSPAVRDANWPPGGTVPTDLAGCWQPKFIDPKNVLCLGGYTWDWVNSVPNGNVVVNGAEIDFISDLCGNAATFGYDRYHYAITGNTLVLTRSGSRTCGWALQGSWTKVAGQ